MSLSAFFREKAIKPQHQSVIVSERFQESGKPIPWEIRAITEDEHSEIKKECTTINLFKGRQTTKFDQTKYVNKLIAACVVFPDLKDAELQKSYGVASDTDLLRVMLISGEHNRLAQIVNEINGFNTENVEEEKEEVKNS